MSHFCRWPDVIPLISGPNQNTVISSAWHLRVFPIDGLDRFHQMSSSPLQVRERYDAKTVILTVTELLVSADTTGGEGVRGGGGGGGVGWGGGVWGCGGGGCVGDSLV